MPKRIATYREFWPHYLREHAKPATRAIHFAGTAIATASVAGLILSGNVWFLPGILIGGYGPAWTAHFFVEHNRPATFQYPLVAGFRLPHGVGMAHRPAGRRARQSRLKPR
jgi:hypothetical protein